VDPPPLPPLKGESMYEDEVKELCRRISEREIENDADRIEIARLKLIKHFSLFSDLDMLEEIERGVFNRVVKIIKEEDYMSNYTLDKLDLEQEFRLIKDRINTDVKNVAQ
jgi:hypothetical protein